VEEDLEASGRPLLDSPDHFSRTGINALEDLFAALAVDSQGAHALAAGAKLITDDDNRMATSSVYDFGTGLDAQSMGRLLAPFDPLRNPDSWVYREFRDRLSFPYIARRLAMFTTTDGSVRDRISAIARALETPAAASAVDAVLRSDQRESEGEGASVVAHGAQLVSANDWKALSELDSALEQIPWTDAWKLDAVQMRAEWRSRVTSPRLRRREGDGCIAIIDEAIVAQPSLALYGLRARCAVVAGRNDVLIESLWNLGNSTYNNARRLGAEQRHTARQNLDTIVTALHKNLPPGAQGGFDAARRDEVVRKLQAHIAGLE